MRPHVISRAMLMLAAVACARGLTRAEKEDIHRWLLCEECREGELKRVTDLRDRAVPALAEALRGPPPDRRANMQVQVQDVHDLVGVGAITDQGYSNHYGSNYVALYQLRAIRALRAIDTPKSHAALVAALPLEPTFRSDVREALGAAALTIVSVTGDSLHAAVDSFVKTNPVVSVKDSSTGAGMPGVPVAFRVDSGGGIVSDSVVVTDSSGHATVRWQMGDSARTNVLRIVAAGRLLRVRAFGHEPGLHLAFLTQPAKGIVGQLLTPAPRIAVQDAWGVTQTGMTGPVNIHLIDNPAHAMVLPPTVDTLAGGTATLDHLVISSPGFGFRLRVNASGMHPAVSDTFAVVVP